MSTPNDEGSCVITAREQLESPGPLYIHGHYPLLFLATKHGAPASGVIVPKPHPDYTYTTTENPEDSSIKITWKRKKP